MNLRGGKTTFVWLDPILVTRTSIGRLHLPARVPPRPESLHVPHFWGTLENAAVLLGLGDHQLGRNFLSGSAA